MQNRFKSGRSSDDDDGSDLVFTDQNDQDAKPAQDDSNQPLSIQQ